MEKDISDSSTETETSESEKSESMAYNSVEGFVKERKLKTNLLKDYQRKLIDGKIDDTQQETLSSEEDSSSCSCHSTVETPVVVDDKRVVSPTSMSSNVQAPKKKARMNPLEKTEIFMGLGRELLSYVKQDDPQDIYGKHIANKLRALQGYQRTLAEKLINDVLFEAEMGTLTRDFRIVNCR